MTNERSWCGVERALEFAQLSLASPPGEHLKTLTKAGQIKANIDRKVRFVERYEPRGSLVLRFVLPLWLCPRYNELLRADRFKKTRLGRKAFEYIFKQNRFDRGELLIGRPFVRFVRFSVKDPDDDSSWTKVPLDVLVTKEGTEADAHHMRLLEDDRRGAAETRAWWEPGGARIQFVYCDVWEDPC